MYYCILQPYSHLDGLDQIDISGPRFILFLCYWSTKEIFSCHDKCYINALFSIIELLLLLTQLDIFNIIEVEIKSPLTHKIMILYGNTHSHDIYTTYYILTILPITYNFDVQLSHPFEYAFKNLIYKIILSVLYVLTFENNE